MWGIAIKEVWFFLLDYFSSCVSVDIDSGFKQCFNSQSNRRIYTYASQLKAEAEKRQHNLNHVPVFYKTIIIIIVNDELS